MKITNINLDAETKFVGYDNENVTQNNHHDISISINGREYLLLCDVAVDYSVYEEEDTGYKESTAEFAYVTVHEIYTEGETVEFNNDDIKKIEATIQQYLIENNI